MDGADLELFERSVGAATARATGAELDAALVELGWLDALAVDAQGAVSSLFGQQGAAGSTSSALDWVLRGALGLDPAGPVVVLPALGETDPPGAIDGDQAIVLGLASSSLTRSAQATVVARAGDLVVAATVDTSELTIREVHGIDPWLALRKVTGTARITDRTAVEWEPALATAQLALGHELAGASGQMLELARQHALERVQFGQPIASFQAIRHRLADAFIAIETADALLDAAWEDGSPTTAAMAKALAGRSARIVARHCQQVLAGIGFTTEHDLHRYVRRVLVLDQLLGASRSLTRELGTDLLRERRLPPMLPL